MTAAGIDVQAVEDLIGSDATLLDFRLKNRGVRPSEEDERAVAARQEDTSVRLTEHLRLETVAGL